MNPIRSVLVQCLSMVLMVNSQICGANENRTPLPGGAVLAFSAPLTIKEQAAFGSGWKIATYTSSEREKFDLFPLESFTSEGGVIFGDSISPKISPTGKYAVIDVLRVGIVTPGAFGRPQIYTRQYCPVLEAKTGCVLSNQSGEICAGQWVGRSDRWVVPGSTDDASNVMLERQFPDANALWNNYENSVGKPFHASIRNRVFSTFGVYNLMVCDRLGANNVAAYKNIAMTLKKDGDNVSSEYIAKKLQDVVARMEYLELRKISARRAFLFDGPSDQYQSKMYLIEGDEVRIIRRKNGGWLKINYIGKNGRSIQKWIRSESIG